MAAWTSPRTWVAGAVVTAAQLNAHLRDNLQALLPSDVVAGTSWTPTLTQSGTVTKTVTYAEWQQFGKWVFFIAKLSATATGTGNAKVTISLPVTASTSNFSAVPIGSGAIYDSSAALVYPGLTELESTTTCALQAADQQSAAATTVLGLTGTAFSAAIATGDGVFMSGFYEAA